MECCNNLKIVLLRLAFSLEQNFISGDPDGVIR
jgi:hypothetical protein